MLSCNFCLENISQWSLAWIDMGTFSKGKSVGDVVGFAVDRDGENLFSVVRPTKS
jgi:hypothetical protein